MKTKHKQNLLAAALVGALALTTTIARAQDPLPSWNNGAAKKSITEFVTKVTTPGSPDFVPVPERIATFDNDGTLWCEQPMHRSASLRASIRSKCSRRSIPSGKPRSRSPRCSRAT